MSPGTINSSEYYYDGYVKAEGFTYEQWVSTMNQVHMGDYVILPHHEVGLDNQNTLT